jgi:hypothetical protein
MQNLLLLHGSSLENAGGCPCLVIEELNQALSEGLCYQQISHQLHQPGPINHVIGPITMRADNA